MAIVTPLWLVQIMMTTLNVKRRAEADFESNYIAH